MNQSNFLEVISALEADSKLYEIFKNCPYEILRELSKKNIIKMYFFWSKTKFITRST